EVEVRLAGYQTFKTTVNPAPGEQVRLFAQLSPQARTGTLDVGSNPQGAEVYLGGTLRGRTPLTLSLPPGWYDLRLFLPGYSEHRGQVEVRPGETTPLFVQLVPLKGVVELYVNVDARVFLNGREVGETRGGYLRFEAPMGRHELTLVSPGYRTLVQTVETYGNQVLRFTLTPL
ncbi:MAG: PEGA domain-containing protein, partial [Thermaceae bacterium]